ncbi:MAG: hydantoinase B/oxoprolinase family protein [Chloroflexi bacterium]|nr:hydantoinase B/oxoprolinase family protein [Chloroflexota bacterium]
MPKVDPITFAVIRHRLFNIVEEAIIALKNVSGTHITSEGHDLMVSLYRADGGLLISGAGFLHHIVPASWAVKHILREFSADPGIFEDDVYFLNDPYVAALHAPDAYLVAPIHHDGQLVAFAANFVHVTDIGAMSPGGFCPDATDCYQEGFRTKGLKLVDRGRLRRDVFETIANIGRVPDLSALDLRSQIAACTVAKRRMGALFSEFGPEVVDTVCQELIDQSEELLRRRLRELPDGTWRGRQYLDSKGELHRVELALTKREDRLSFDFTGTSPQVPFGSNCTYCAAVGGVFAPLFPLLCYDIVWNDGATRPVEVIAPEGSLVNCRFPAPVSIATVGMLQIANNLATYCISKMLSASPAYAGEATAVWHGSHTSATFFGTDQHGQTFVSALTDTFAGSGGAFRDRDGIDVGGEIPNLVSRWGNAEMHEMTTPILYVYRRLVRDSGGAGKYRGGLSTEAGIAIHDSDDVGFVTFNRGVNVPQSYGIAGGYPACCVDLLIFKDAGFRDGSGALPHNLSSTMGVPEPADWGVYRMDKGDLFYYRNSGGGGYGDPLERDPAAVLQDVTNALVSSQCASGIYGVVLTSDSKDVDDQATTALRTELRARRLKEAAVQTGNTAICPRCDEGSTESRTVCLREGPLARIGPLCPHDTPLVLRELFCSSCGALIDVQIAEKSDRVFCDDVLGRASTRLAS